MDYFQAIILGVIQGFTEFLPVSSSGHLVLFQKLLGLETHSIEFDIAAHLGTLASILTVYRAFITNSMKTTFTRGFHLFDENRRLLRMIIIASVPTGILGIAFKDLFESLFSSLLSVGVSLSLTGLILMATKFRSPADDSSDFINFQVNDLVPLTWKIAVMVGLAQSFAIAPGISRSGSTIAAGVFLGLPQSLAALFSFMISIPAILGAGLLKFKDIQHFDSQMILNLCVGFLVAYVSGVIGLKLILHYVRRGRLHLFSYYLWAVSAATIVWAVLQ